MNSKLDQVVEYYGEDFTAREVIIDYYTHHKVNELSIRSLIGKMNAVFPQLYLTMDDVKYDTELSLFMFPQNYYAM